ncbi:MAG: MOSC N-terminal beta barrel domain-containing protein [Bacteroidota bacterium]
MITVAELCIYPIKSTYRIALDEAEVEPRGLRWDRRWMLIDENSRFISQRKVASLTQLRSTLTPDGLALHTPAGDHLTVPVPAEESARERVTVWGDDVEAVSYPDAVNDWFSCVLERPVRLVYMDAAATRPIDLDYRAAPNEEVSFADGYPLLVTTTASLRDLNARLGSSVPMNRFRPNLVLTGDLAPFEEDRWHMLEIGEVRFRAVKPCGRCVVITTDQDTGERHKEPLKTLAAYRRFGGKINFGHNLVPETTGTIRVADAVRVTYQP